MVNHDLYNEIPNLYAKQWMKLAKMDDFFASLFFNVRDVRPSRGGHKEFFLVLFVYLLVNVITVPIPTFKFSIHGITFPESLQPFLFFSKFVWNEEHVCWRWMYAIHRYGIYNSDKYSQVDRLKSTYTHIYLNDPYRCS